MDEVFGTHTCSKATACETGKIQLTGYLCRWWQVLGSNQHRLSRRFYRPLDPKWSLPRADHARPRPRLPHQRAQGDGMEVQVSARGQALGGVDFSLPYLIRTAGQTAGQTAWSCRRCTGIVRFDPSLKGRQDHAGARPVRPGSGCVLLGGGRGWVAQQSTANRVRSSSPGMTTPELGLIHRRSSECRKPPTSSRQPSAPQL